MNPQKCLTPLSLLLILFSTLTNSQPLSTSSRWIVDAGSGNRVKLSCVNWPGHLEAMIPEGLQKKPVNRIVSDTASMGFNCVRLTWATYMYTRPNFSSLTVAQSLERLNLSSARAGIAKNNPGILNQTLLDAQRLVIDEVGAHNMMVVLDNHVSLPKWCCGNSDGNGFFGDLYFDPREWVQGSTLVASRYKGNPTVVAMSMRNELRGPRQNENDWYTYMQQGATAIHTENEDILVILSGLSFDTNLSFLRNRPLNLNNLDNKLVYERHWYAFGDSSDQWLFNTNQICSRVTQWFMGQSGFLMRGQDPTPLFLSEFGVDQRGDDEVGNRYLSCLLAAVAQDNIDWALWSMQGSYMIREGRVEMEEVYGIFDVDWNLRDSTMAERLQLVRRMIQDPRSNESTYLIMYHPQTGRCIQIGRNNTLFAGDCENSSRWSHENDGSPIRLLGSENSTSGCLTVAGDGLPATVTTDCSSQNSIWRSVSSSKLHLSAKDGNGTDLCLELDGGSDSTIMSKKCLCLGDDLADSPRCGDNPQIQWFKLVPSNRK